MRDNTVAVPVIDERSDAVPSQMGLLNLRPGLRHRGVRAEVKGRLALGFRAPRGSGRGGGDFMDCGVLIHHLLDSQLQVYQGASLSSNNYALRVFLVLLF